MSVKRVVDTAFWNDSKVSDMFSVEDRYFMLYLLTNPHTTQLGIYELPLNRAANETGYSKETIRVLLERFEKAYGIIKYSKISNEVAIKNYLRHSIVKGGKPVMDCLIKEEKKVKDKELLGFVFDNLTQYADSGTLNLTVIDFINNININDNDNERIVHDSSKDELEENFDILYKQYPKKAGRTNAFKRYKLWVTTGKSVCGKRIKLTNRQIWEAIKVYKDKMESSDTELQYYKNFDTFLGDSILDYVKEVV